jgi:hypothetical protein
VGTCGKLPGERFDDADGYQGAGSFPSGSWETGAPAEVFQGGVVGLWSAYSEPPCDALHNLAVHKPSTPPAAASVSTALSTDPGQLFAATEPFRLTPFCTTQKGSGRPLKGIAKGGATIGSRKSAPDGTSRA